MRGYRARRAFDGERELPGGATVLVGDDGLIAGVEPFAAALPDDVEVHTFEGATLLPGLIDAHVHLCGDNSPMALDQLPELGPERLDEIITASMRATLAAGVTTVRDLGDYRWTVLERGARPGEPRLLASGPPLTTLRGHCWNMGGETSGEAGLRAAVRERFERGADVVKVMTSGGMMTETSDVLRPQFTSPELRAVVEEAHGLGLPVVGHAHALPAVEMAVVAGFDGVEHVTGMTADGLRLPSDEVLALMIERQVRVGPTPGLVEDMLHPPPHIQALMERVGFVRERILEHLGGLYRAGLRLTLGADSGINPAKPHGVFPEAARHLTEAGVPVLEVLRIATSGNADALDLGGDRAVASRAGGGPAGGGRRPAERDHGAAGRPRGRPGGQGPVIPRLTKRRGYGSRRASRSPRQPRR